MTEYAQDGTPIRYDVLADSYSSFGSKNIGYKPKVKYNVVMGGNNRFSSREEADRELARLNAEVEAEYKSRGTNTWYVGYSHPKSSGPAGRAQITPGSWYAESSHGTMPEQTAKAEAARLNEVEKIKNFTVTTGQEVFKPGGKFYRPPTTPLPSPEQQGENLARLIEQMQQQGRPAPGYDPVSTPAPAPLPKSKLPLIIGGVALVATVAALWWRFRK